MLCIKCIFLLSAVMLLLDFASAAPTFVTDNAYDTDALKATHTRPAFYDSAEAPILFRRLRRNLAQMFVGNHHYNHHKSQQTSKPVTRRPHSRRHGDRGYGEFRLAQA